MHHLCADTLSTCSHSCHSSPPTLSNGARSKIVHLHGDGKVLEVVEELEEGSELIKGDSLKSQKKAYVREHILNQPWKEEEVMMEIMFSGEQKVA